MKKDVCRLCLHSTQIVRTYEYTHISHAHTHIRALSPFNKRLNFPTQKILAFMCSFFFNIAMRFILFTYVASIGGGCTLPQMRFKFNFVSSMVCMCIGKWNQSENPHTKSYGFSYACGLFKLVAE